MEINSIFTTVMVEILILSFCNRFKSVAYLVLNDFSSRLLIHGRRTYLKVFCLQSLGNKVFIIIIIIMVCSLSLFSSQETISTANLGKETKNNLKYTHVLPAR